MTYESVVTNEACILISSENLKPSGFRKSIEWEYNEYKDSDIMTGVSLQEFAWDCLVEAEKLAENF